MTNPSNTRNSLIFLSALGVLLKVTKRPNVRKRAFYIYKEIERRFNDRRQFRLGELLDEIERRQRRKAKIIFWSDLALYLCRHFKFTGIEYFYWGSEWCRVKWRRGHLVDTELVTETEINRRHRRKGWTE